MSLKSLNDSSLEVFAKADNEANIIKTIFIGTCSEIDRYSKLVVGVNLFHRIDNYEFYKLKMFYPNFKDLNLNQINLLLLIFVAIRDVSAHLYLNKPIFIDQDICSFIQSIVKTQYRLSNDKEITLYGMFCVVSLFCQKYQMWPLSRELIRYDILSDIMDRGMANKQRSFQLAHTKLCGNSKPYNSFEHDFILDVDVTFFIDTIRRTLTKLIFSLESQSKPNNQTYTEVPSLKALLYNFDCLKNDDDLINRIVELRNCWLHGYHLFDNVKADNRTFKFDLDYLFNILKDIKRKFDDTSFQDVTYAIHECGSRIIDFYTLRNVELTFKILDSRLFKEDKIKERIDNTIKAYSHFNNPSENFYNQAYALLLNQEKKWYLIGSKFEDFMERSFVGKRLSIYEFSSKKGFDIGGYHVDADEMVLTDIDCATRYQLTVNGKKLKDYKKRITAKYALFDICQIEI